VSAEASGHGPPEAALFVGGLVGGWVLDPILGRGLYATVAYLIAITVTLDLLCTPRGTIERKHPAVLVGLGAFALGFFIDQVTGIAVDAAFRSAL
jgi:hypothetical protein